MLQCLEGINPNRWTAEQGFLYCLRDCVGISNWWPEREETAPPDFTQQDVLSKAEESEITFKTPREGGMFFPSVLSLQLLVSCIISASLTPSPTAHITPRERFLKYEMRKSVTCQEHPQLLMLHSAASCSCLSQNFNRDLGLVGAESFVKYEN